MAGLYPLARRPSTQTTSAHTPETPLPECHVRLGTQEEKIVEQVEEDGDLEEIYVPVIWLHCDRHDWFENLGYWPDPIEAASLAQKHIRENLEKSDIGND